MNRRIFSLGVLAALLCSVALPAFADDGSSQSGGGEDNSGGDGGDDSSGGDTGGDGGTGDGSSGDGGSGDGGSHSDHDSALRAVDAKDALPLESMLAVFKRYGDYTVIDVKLVRRDGVLLYLIKFIDTNSQVRKAWFEAKTGDLVTQ